MCGKGKTSAKANGFNYRYLEFRSLEKHIRKDSSSVQGINSRSIFVLKFDDKDFGTHWQKFGPSRLDLKPRRFEVRCTVLQKRQ